MVNSEIRHDRVERRIRVGQRLGIALIETQMRLPVSRLGQHRRGKIEPRDVGATRRCRGGDDSGAAADIEDAPTGRYVRGIEQGLDKPRARPREGAVVFGRRALPAGMLEGPDGFGIKYRPGSTLRSDREFAPLSAPY